MRKRYIECDLPLKDISHYSAIEKNIRHGHPSSLLIWWARRPLAASRATNFAALIDFPDNQKERRKIHDLITKITPWEAVKGGGNRHIKQAQKMISEQWRSPPKILDPFSGGGSIPLEALRLGCEVYSSDYNPVAFFIQKATLEWPQKYGIDISNPQGIDQLTLRGNAEKVNLLSFLVEKWSKRILEEAKEEIEQFYPLEPEGQSLIGYLWARTVPCQNPNCGKEIPLIKQFWLAKFGGKKSSESVAYEIKADKRTGTLNFVIRKGNEVDFDPSEGTISKGNARCPFCKQVTKVAAIRKLASEGKMGESMIAVISDSQERKGKKYRIATERDRATYQKAKEYLQHKIINWEWLESPLPEEKLPPIGALGFRVQRYGLRKWKDLFNTRQKLALITFIDKIKGSYENILRDCEDITKNLSSIDKDELAKVVMGYLSIMVCRLADFSSTICLLNPTGGRGVVHTFGRNALPMTWDYMETNVFNPKGASWDAAIQRTLMVIENLSFDTRTNILCGLSTATLLTFKENHFDAVFTDPPYYDNVPYADLSDFFYVWLKRCVGDMFPEIFSRPLTPKKDEIIADGSRQENPKLFFEEKLSEAFKEIYRVLKPNGIATIIYAYRTTKGWETMLNSLINAKLVVTASWPIHTERSGRLRAAASAALASSIYMVCRKTSRDEIGFWSEMKPKIKEKVESKLQQFWNEGIAGGDFFISAIGPGMEIFSKYASVESYAGDKVSTIELLDYIRSIVTKFVVNQLLMNGSQLLIDKESQFYLAYRWTYLDNEVEFDDARKLASGLGAHLEDLWTERGIVQKKGKFVRVLGPKERGMAKNPSSMVDVMHSAALLWERSKTDKLRDLLSKTGYGRSEAFWQFCQAVAESLLPGNKEKQLLEGLLVGRQKYSDLKVGDRKQKKLDEFKEE